MADRFFNLIRKEQGTKVILRRKLPEQTAFRELKHWKQLARNSGGRVYFELVEVPPELAGIQ
jgi:hypothetical protein